MHTFYTRISDDNHAFLTEVKAQTGLSMANITNLILTQARTEGWTITPRKD